MMLYGIERSGNFAFVFCASKLRGWTDMGFSKLVSQFAVCLTLSRGEGCFMHYMSCTAHTDTHLLWAADGQGLSQTNKRKWNCSGISFPVSCDVCRAGVMARECTSRAWTVPEHYVQMPPGGSASALESQQDFNQPQQSNRALCKLS